MRPHHLALAALLLASAVAVLWFVIDPFSLAPRAGEVQAAASEEGSEGGGLSDAAAAAAAMTPEGARGRVALPPTEPVLDSLAAAARTTRDKPRLSGRVVDPAGAGVPGASVCAASGRSWVTIPLDVEPEAVPKGWIRIERTTTDAEGRFVFETLQPGPLRLAVRAAGFAPKSEDRLDLPDRPEHVLPDIQMARGVVLSGRVVDREGKGVGGAALLAALEGGVEAAGPMVRLPGRGVPLATTGAEGGFRIDHLAAGPWRLIVDAEGYAVSEEEGRTERAGEVQAGLLFRVERGSEISGRLRAEDGALPEGLRVTARPNPDRDALRAAGRAAPQGEQQGEEDPRAAESRARSALVGADGSFTLRGLVGDMRYSLSAWRTSDDPGGWKRIGGVAVVQAYAGERGVELLWEPESALLFRAVDARTGAPLTEFSVWAGVAQEKALRDEKGAVVHHFEGGRARYGELRPKRGGPHVRLRIAAAGFEDREEKTLSLAPGQELDLGDLPLQPARIVVARVVDDRSGVPVAGARVLFGTKPEAEIERYLESSPDTDWWGEVGVRYARTGKDGTARLSSLPGKSVVACARAKGYLSSDPFRVLLPEDGDREIELRLKCGGTVLVVVRGAAGEIVEGIPVEHRRPADVRRRAGTASQRVAVKTDALGTVRFEALVPGVHAFRTSERADPNGWYDDDEESDQEGWVESVTAEGSSATLEFLAPSRGGLQGSVREAGRPLEGARLNLVGGEGEEHTWFGPGVTNPYAATGDHDGRYRFENLRCGAYTLLVTHPSRRMPGRFQVSVERPARSFDVELDVATIEGRVTGEDGAPLAAIEVQAIGEGQDDYGQSWGMVLSEDDRGSPKVDWRQQSKRGEQSDAQGRFRLRGVRTGEPLHVYASGETVQPTTSAEITLGPDEARRGVDFVLKYAGAIEVTLAGEAAGRRGGRGNWYQVRAYRAEEEGKEQMVDQQHLGSWNRTCRLRSLAPGRYRVSLAPNGEESSDRVQSQEVEVVARTTVGVVFQER